MSNSQSSQAASATPITNSDSTSAGTGRSGKVAFVVAVISVLLTWVTMFAAPAVARMSASRGDYDNVFTFAAIAWSVVIALDLVAIFLGLIGARQPTAKVRSGAAVAIGATGILNFAVSVIGSNLIRSFLT